MERSPDPATAITVHVQAAPVVFIVILGVLVSVPLLTLLGRGPTALLPVLLLLAAIWLGLAVVLAMLLSRSVSLLSDRIRYSTLLRHWELPYRDIAEVSLAQTLAQGYRTRRVSTRLRLARVSGGAALIIPLEPFRRRDIARVIDLLARRSPHAVIDPGARALQTTS